MPVRPIRGATTCLVAGCCGHSILRHHRANTFSDQRHFTNVFLIQKIPFGKDWALKMSDVMSPLFCEVRGLLEGEFTETFESDLFDNSNWSLDNSFQLNRSLEMALSGDVDRLNMESPDSGIHMSNYDFDIEGCSAILSGNDPNLNGGELNEEKSIISDQSVNCQELIMPPVNSDFELVSHMDSEQEDQENIAVDTNSSSARAIESHSYSVMKVKRPKSLKSRRQPTVTKKQLTITSQGQKYDIPVRRNKKKLYEFEPLKDPIAERNRLNALNAKKNRDRKKQELLEANSEIEKLREENDELRAETDSYKDMLDDARREVEELKMLLKIKGVNRLGNKVSAKSLVRT